MSTATPVASSRRGSGGTGVSSGEVRLAAVVGRAPARRPPLAQRTGGTGAAAPGAPRPKWRRTAARAAASAHAADHRQHRIRDATGGGAGTRRRRAAAMRATLASVPATGCASAPRNKPRPGAPIDAVARDRRAGRGSPPSPRAAPCAAAWRRRRCGRYCSASRASAASRSSLNTSKVSEMSS